MKIKATYSLIGHLRTGKMEYTLTNEEVEEYKGILADEGENSAREFLEELVEDCGNWSDIDYSIEDRYLETLNVEND